MKTPQDQVRGREGEGDFPATQLIVNSTGEHYLSNTSQLTS